MTTVAATYTADVSDQLGAVKPWVAAAANAIANTFGLTEMSGYGTRSGVSDHPRGLAIDIPAARAVGDQVAAFVTQNAARLGVKYVIWQQAIWKPGAPTWTPMTAIAGDRPGYDPNHRRHVHVSFTDAAPAEGSLSWLQQAAGTVAGAIGGVVATVGSAAQSLNPLSSWSTDAMTIALKIAAVGAGLALVVVGANRLVAPAVMSGIGKVAEVVT